MKFFKNPIVALILALILVVVSSVLSIRIKYGNECTDVTDAFYDGVYVNGEYEASIAEQLQNICAYAEEIALIADSNNVDADIISSEVFYLKSEINYSSEAISYIHSLYLDVLSAVKKTQLELNAGELSPGDQNKLDELLAQIADAQALIKASSYNETVRLFIRKNSGALTSFMMDFAGVYRPDYFQ